MLMGVTDGVTELFFAKRIHTSRSSCERTVNQYDPALYRNLEKIVKYRVCACRMSPIAKARFQGFPWTHI